MVKKLTVELIGTFFLVLTVGQVVVGAETYPRLPDGTPNLGPAADGTGYWDRGPGPAR